MTKQEMIALQSIEKELRQRSHQLLIQGQRLDAMGDKNDTGVLQTICFLAGHSDGYKMAASLLRSVMMKKKKKRKNKK